MDIKQVFVYISLLQNYWLHYFKKRLFFWCLFSASETFILSHDGNRILGQGPDVYPP